MDKKTFDNCKTALRVVSETYFATMPSSEKTVLLAGRWSNKNGTTTPHKALQGLHDNLDLAEVSCEWPKAKAYGKRFRNQLKHSCLYLKQFLIKNTGKKVYVSPKNDTELEKIYFFFRQSSEEVSGKYFFEFSSDPRGRSSQQYEFFIITHKVD